MARGRTITNNPTTGITNQVQTKVEIQEGSAMAGICREPCGWDGHPDIEVAENGRPFIHCANKDCNNPDVQARSDHVVESAGAHIPIGERCVQIRTLERQSAIPFELICGRMGGSQKSIPRIQYTLHAPKKLSRSAVKRLRGKGIPCLSMRRQPQQPPKR